MCAPIKGRADCLQHFVLPILPCKICPCFCYIWNWVSEIETFPSCRISHSAKQVLWHKFTKYWPWKPRNVQAKGATVKKGCDYGLDRFGVKDFMSCSFLSEHFPSSCIIAPALLATINGNLISWQAWHAQNRTVAPILYSAIQVCNMFLQGMTVPDIRYTMIFSQWVSIISPCLICRWICLIGQENYFSSSDPRHGKYIDIYWHKYL